MFEFFIFESFIETLEKLDNKIQQQVKEKLRFLQTAESPLLLAKKLKGYRNVYRFRAGDYRMVFRVEKRKIILLLVHHRKEVYKNL